MNALPQFSRFIRNLADRMRRLSCIFQNLVSASGWCDPGPIYAELLSRTRIGNTYSLMFLSIPGRDYSIEQTIDLIHWSPATPEIKATATTTTWVSATVPAGVEVYFRIRLLPFRQLYCYTRKADGANAPSAYCPFTDELATLE